MVVVGPAAAIVMSSVLLTTVYRYVWLAFCDVSAILAPDGLEALIGSCFCVVRPLFVAK